uniref:VWFA domain-containing protein n=1 Tax=Ditylenchus dipsaci TaxID=166011 RepID=A0A915DKZ2_9BILA
MENSGYKDPSSLKICRPVDRPLDLLFILDGSGSVGGTTFDTQIKMLNRIIDLVDVGDHKSRIAVMQYSSYPNMEFLFNTYKDSNQNIRPKLGTTKTGKALSKAYDMFHGDPSSGSRQGKDNIAQVAIVVSDGHSHDDAISPAIHLRESGVHLIALGIGTHINEGELLQITGDKEFAFNNLSLPESVDQFTSNSLGFDGADIVCNPDSFRISVTTRNQLHGHFYVQDYFHDARCKWNNTETSSQSSSTSEANISLTVGLRDCGVQHQFSLNPKGILFESTIELQFHPTLATPNDKTFKVHCFYHDKGDPNEIDWSMIKEHTQRKSKKEKDTMPCSLSVVKDVPFGFHQQNDACSADVNNLYLGDKSLTNHYDTYQSMLVHSCSLIDMLNNKQEHILIDDTGCSVEESLLENPEYSNSLSVVSRGIAIRKADGPFLKVRCSLKFCDRLMGECEGIVPPKCTHKNKRQMTDASSLLTFDRSKLEKNRMLLKRRIGADQKVQVTVSHLDADISKSGVPRADTQKLPIAEETANQETEDEEHEKGNDDEDSEDHPIPTEKDNAKAVSEDPFQEEMNKRDNAETQDESLRPSMELDRAIIASLNQVEFTVESEVIYVRNRKSRCLIIAPLSRQ